MRVAALSCLLLIGGCQTRPDAVPSEAQLVSIAQKTLGETPTSWKPHVFDRGSRWQVCFLLNVPNVIDCSAMVDIDKKTLKVVNKRIDG